MILQNRTAILCQKLEELGVEFYRHPNSNIVTMKQQYISDEIAIQFGLIPDNHAAPNWYKIVVMEHVTMEKLKPFMMKLEKELTAI